MSAACYVWTAACLVALSTATTARADTVHLSRVDGGGVVVEVNAPPPSAACPPLALLSPGAGGNAHDLAYLAHGLAHAGWTAIVIGHRESGRQALREAIRRHGLRRGLLALTTDTAAYRARFDDIGAALRWAVNRCQPPFKALIGHSMGAATTMIEAGADNTLGLAGQRRFDAYVAISPQGRGALFGSHAWHAIRAPMLIVTGTRDRGLQGDWTWRTQPYADLAPGCARLAVIKGAGHLQLSGTRGSARIQDDVTDQVTTFLKAAMAGHCATLPAPADVTVHAK